MNKKLKTAIIILILVFLAFVAIYAFIPQESNLFQITDDISLVMAIIAGIIMLLTFTSLGWKPMEGKVWFLLSLGFFTWILGESIWLYAKLLLGIMPASLIANVFFLLGNILIITGLIIELKITKEAMQKKDFLKSLLLTLPLAAVLVYYVIVPTLAAVKYDLPIKILYLSLHLGDLITIFLALAFFFVFKGSKVAKSWLMITIALLLGTIASITFLYLNWNGLYSGILLAVTRLLWIMDYILLALGAYYHRLVMRGEV